MIRGTIHVRMSDFQRFFFHASSKIKINYFESLFFKKLLVMRESNVSSAISSHVFVNQMNDILVACVQVIAVVYVRKADTYPNYFNNNSVWPN